MNTYMYIDKRPQFIITATGGFYKSNKHVIAINNNNKMDIRVIDAEDPAGLEKVNRREILSHLQNRSAHLSKFHKVLCIFALTLTFANNNSVSSKPAHNYDHCKTEMLQIPLQNAIAPECFTDSTKELVGNSKEYRIENNKCDLRIIGNNNRILISCNQGNLQIIGNTTGLEITNNTAQISYTGNDGSIYLGSDSTQQAVDFIGNDNKLKIVK